MTANSSELKKLGADLIKAAGKVPEKARLAIRKAGTDIKRDAQAIAPVDTGFLKSSISMQAQGNKTLARVEVGPTANYAAFVELGTHKMAAQPYLRPATDKNIPKLDKAIAQIASEVL